MTRPHDVVVVGAGPAGSAAAHYLAVAGFDVLLLDKSEFPRDKTCGDGLTPRALAVLADMGLREAVDQRGCRIEAIELIAPAGGTAGFPVPRFGNLPEYMVIIPRLILDDLIRQRAVESGAQFEGGVEVIEVRNVDGGVRIRAERDNQPVDLSARLVVVATGAALKLVKRIGLAPRRPLTMLAARAYFDGLTDLAPVVQVHFDGIPLPGYGWVFPVSASSANIGAGVIPAGWLRRPHTTTSRRAFEMLVEALRSVLGSARQVGPMKGYPIRIDFDRSPTYAERVLLAGEAAGLANPLTGEGIDYALESGRIAAEHATGMLGSEDFSRARFAAYDRALRDRFQSMIVSSRRLGDLYLNAPLLNRMVAAAGRLPDIRSLVADVTVGNRGLRESLSLGTLLRVFLAA
ncbi:MAG TPA: geranylgeranyl reductase family protein [Anaerolineales bacterium]|nr:geranylgeranyl reductase family protein [Anaerolineales bacterium]